MNKKETKHTGSLEQKLLGLLRAHARSMHVGELRKLMMLNKQEHGELADQLGLMAQAGLVTELPGGKYRAPKQRARDAAADGSAPVPRRKRSDSAADGGERPARVARGIARDSADAAAERGPRKVRGAIEDFEPDAAEGGDFEPDDAAADSG